MVALLLFFRFHVIVNSTDQFQARIVQESHLLNEQNPLISLKYIKMMVTIENLKLERPNLTKFPIRS